MSGDNFTARFADCHYDETFFPPLGGEKIVPEERRELDAFTDTGKVTKSHIPAANTPARIDIPIGLTNVAANESSTTRVNEMVIDDIFSFVVAAEIIKGHEDIEPRSVDECKERSDWPKWKDAIQVELNSFEKRGVFGPVVQTPQVVKPVGYKWVFTRKHNEKNEIARYKA
ncbi:unnamed protein product [Prunus brigantina]